MKKNKSNSNSGSGNGFQALGLSEPVYHGIVRMGYRMPTPVQRKSLPVILTGADTVVMARTGSGKTAAFLIPLLEQLVNHDTNKDFGGACRAVILSPTRELSLQTLKVMHKLSRYCQPQIKTIGIHGGEGMEQQFDALASKPDVIVATPGRLAHHLSEIPDFTLVKCTMCIADEADRLLEMGFAPQLRQITCTLPEHCQRIMTSATMPKVLVEFTKSGLFFGTSGSTDLQVVRLDQEATVSDELRIAFITCKHHDKDAALLHLIHQITTTTTNDDNNKEEDDQHNDKTAGKKKKNNNHNNTGGGGLTLIFCATRHHVEYITTLLNISGIPATMIYGTLDQEARKSNLAAFRCGKTPILVVTDVAARGIDVPLIDHVIHYNFASSAKLFVHRSGRAARAGRIGYCWALVEPEDMPYMVDLHLFLGRKLCMGVAQQQQQRGSHQQQDNDSNNHADNDDYTYTLSDMSPDMVHYGSVPESVLVEEIENVRRIMDSELTGSSQADSLQSLVKVCNNAMKQYRRTRPEASREGVRRAKAILEGERLETGQRVGGGAIPTHPLLRGMELMNYNQRKANGKVVDGLNDLDNARKREDFLRAMANFRPKETIFEAFATGGGKDVSVVSHIDKGRTTNTKNRDTSAALTAMKSMRRQMKLARDKGSALVVAGSSNAQVLNGDVDIPDPEHGDDDADVSGEHQEHSTGAHLSEEQRQEVSVVQQAPPPLPESKRRLSKAERKRLKKNPNSCAVGAAAPVGDTDKPQKSKNRRGTDFRDETFFIDNDYTSNSAQAKRARQVEAAMQPSASTNQKSTTAAALRMEEAMLDIVGDENADLVQKQRMMRWDKSKRKYVQTTVGAELSGDSKSQKLRLESGQLVKSDKRKLGDMYEKWQKKTNRSVGRVGVFDDVTDDATVHDDDDTGCDGGKGRGRGSANKQQRHAGGSRNNNEDGFKSAVQIRKEREAKQNTKFKNMKKSDRRKMTEINKRRDDGGGRSKHDHNNIANKYPGKKGPSSGRWTSNSRK